MKKFADIAVGESASITHTITDEDVRKFVDLTGDNNKLHIDRAFAARTNFKKPVAHGMLGASFISTIIGTKLPGDGALWFAQNLEFLLPVRVGDTLTVKAEVIAKNERNNSIELKTEISNQNKQVVTTGTAKVKMTEVETADPKEAAPARIQNVLVVGASGGIGSAICKRLALDGYNVALHYFSSGDHARNLATEMNKHGITTTCIKADILKVEELAALAENAVRALGSVDAVINAATVPIPHIKFESVEWGEMESQLSINIKSNFQLLKFFLPAMKERRRGKVIFLTTQMTEGTPPPETIGYVTAKSALNGFAKALAVEMGPFNIQVNLVSPGITETELIADLSEKSRLLAVSKTPLRRLGRPDDVASAVAFLLSPDSDYMTGETIRVNGGISMV